MHSTFGFPGGGGVQHGGQGLQRGLHQRLQGHPRQQLLTQELGVEEFNMEVKVFNVAFINIFRGALVNNNAPTAGKLSPRQEMFSSTVSTG